MARSETPSIAFMLFSMTLFFVLTSSSSQAPPEAYLNIQNAARKAVGVAPLVWNDTLASYAQSCATEVAKKCTELLSCNFHLDTYGQNYGKAVAPDNTTTAVQSWVDTQKECTHGKNLTITYDLECYQYTRLIWSKTTSVGCFTAPCLTEKGSSVVICNYYPKGNTPGEKPF